MNFMRNAVLALLMPSAAMATQDGSYYSGWSNPNVNADEMYFKEAANVKQGIEDGEFTSLYIQYHGCVWSEYSNGNNGGDGDNNGDGDDANCGDYEAQWFSGKTQCFRANVGYSLYGVKASQSSSSSSSRFGGGSSSGCDKRHYINSFLTTSGVDTFTGLFGVDTADYGIDGICQVVQEGNNNNNNGNNNNNNYNGNGYDDYLHNQVIGVNAQSLGLGCSADGEFVMATFGGETCNGHRFQGVSDSLDDFNTELSAMGCYKIYDVNGGANENAGGNDDNNSNENGDDEDAYAMELLSASSACSYAEYPDRCPNPNGKTAARSKRVYNKAKTSQRRIPFHMSILSSILFIAGVVMLFKANSVRQKTIETGIEMGRKLDELEEQDAVMRAVSFVADRTRSYKEMLISYAEEESIMSMTTAELRAAMTQEEDLMKDPTKSDVSGTDAAALAVAQSRSTTGGKDDEAVVIPNEEVANAMLADNRVEGGAAAAGTTPGAAKGKKKYKRPLLAKISKFLFRKRRKNKNKKNQQKK